MEIRVPGVAPAAEAGVADNTLGVPAATGVLLTPAPQEAEALLDRFAEAASEAPAAKDKATQPVPAAAEEAAATMVAVAAVRARPTSMAASRAVVGVADHRTSSGVQPTCICGKDGKIQLVTG
jgi:hypothetical protein